MITFNTQEEFEDAVIEVLSLRLKSKVFISGDTVEAILEDDSTGEEISSYTCWKHN